MMALLLGRCFRLGAGDVGYHIRIRGLVKVLDAAQLAVHFGEDDEPAAQHAFDGAPRAVQLHGIVLVELELEVAELAIQNV
jgi:hypothetical protein